VKSDSRLATKTVVPFHSPFYCTHFLLDKSVIYSDSGPLLSQDVLTCIFCAPVNNCIKTANPSNPRFLSVSSSLSKPTSGLIPAPVPDLIELILDRIRDRRRNQSRIPSLSLLGCSSLGLSLVLRKVATEAVLDDGIVEDELPTRRHWRTSGF
jgi:hypothetical protein